MKRFISLFLLLCAIVSQAQVRIVSYNVENFFDTKHDADKQDEDYTPNGKYRWNLTRYNRKIENISRVIVNIGEWNTAAIVGLCEVENEQCLTDLVNYSSLKRKGYQYVHYESPDQRGIDCALLYDPQQFTVVRSDHFAVKMPASDRPTRDILYVCGVVQYKPNYQSKSQTDTLHIMMCHLPSQLGGTEQTAHKRDIAHRVLQHKVDSILENNPVAKIVIMGDMNAKPTDTLAGMHNLMVDMEKEFNGRAGTHKYKGVWSCLDQFYVSNILYKGSSYASSGKQRPISVKANIYSESWIMEPDYEYGGEQPMRCFKYTNYQAGYSDHLPIYLDITF